MKILIIVDSHHKNNTLKIAEAMSGTVNADVLSVAEADNADLMQYDIVGFGSGIYAGKVGKKLFKYIAGRINDLSNVFVFSTSAKGKLEYNGELEAYLNGKCKNVLGSFACKGFCKWFIFALAGGISKGHPDETDFENAKTFMKQIVEKHKSLMNQNY